jgi:hypothetical protein
VETVALVVSAELAQLTQEAAAEVVDLLPLVLYMLEELAALVLSSFAT